MGNISLVVNNDTAFFKKFIQLNTTRDISKSISTAIHRFYEWFCYHIDTMAAFVSNITSIHLLDKVPCCFICTTLLIPHLYIIATEVYLSGQLGQQIFVKKL